MTNRRYVFTSPKYKYIKNHIQRYLQIKFEKIIRVSSFKCYKYIDFSSCRSLGNYKLIMVEFESVYSAIASIGPYIRQYKNLKDPEFMNCLKNLSTFFLKL